MTYGAKMMRIEPPTKEQQERGWVLRPASPNCAAILVRGARQGDHAVDYKKGFVYAETPEEAEWYDAKHGYLDPKD
jgi:hypothetical protein